jgi:hypothetical protein
MSLDAFNASQPSIRSRRIGRSMSSVPLALLVVLLHAVSGGVLWSWGLNYEGVTGSAASKIHPFTYFILAYFGWRVVSSGDPVRFLGRCEQTPASFIMLSAGLVLFIHTVLRAAPGMAGVIDTFIGPALLVMLLARANETNMRVVEITLHVLMTANALLALVEFAADYRVFPYRFDGEFFAFDSRSSALHGHPLANAMVTACYLLALMNGGRSLHARWRLPLIGLQSAALVVFGGRSAMVTAILLGGAFLIKQSYDVLRTGSITILGAAKAAIVMTLAPVVLIGLTVGGFFEPLLLRFDSDGGSANARLEMFNMFSQLPLRDLIVGTDASLVDSIRRVSGLEWGIENPIIKSILYQGLFMTVLMTVAVALFLYEIARRCERGVWLPMLACVILLNTSESIGSKTLILAQFAVIVLPMYRSFAAGDPVWPRQTQRREH